MIVLAHEMIRVLLCKHEIVWYNRYMEDIFKNKSIVVDKLEGFGFTLCGGKYELSKDILDQQFVVRVTVTKAGEFTYHVYDKLDEEEYTLHLTNATGEFVGRVRQELQELLQAFANECFETNVFKSKQAHELINYVSNKYGDELEFLWEKYADNAIWRRKDSKKWYALLAVVSKQKLGLKNDTLVDILNVRLLPEMNSNIVDGKSIFPAYHMNKTNWISVILDNSIKTDILKSMIDFSYLLAKC